MQYNSKHKDEYFEKYLTALNQNHNKEKEINIEYDGER